MVYKIIKTLLVHSLTKIFFLSDIKIFHVKEEVFR